MRDKEKFEEIVISYRSIISKVCFLYAGEEEFEDYYQEVLIQLWHSLPKFRGESKFSTWIYRISLNTCISFIRKDKKMKRVPFSQEMKFWSNDVESKIQIRELYQLINQLNKLEKAMILLWLDEKSYEEIAAITGLSRNNVAVKLSRIKEKLKKMSNQ